MKFPNYLTSTLAIVGAFSLIIMACSANDSNSTTPTSITTTIGKYQISSFVNASNQRSFDVIDTETGIVKSYTKYGADYTLQNTTITH